MAKKEFSQINTQRRGNVADTLPTEISTRGQQATASKEEAAARASQLRTQGRKGCKATRINMAFTPENHEFIRAGASLYHLTMTEFCNRVIAAYNADHPAIMEKGKAFLEQIDTGELPEL